MNDCVKYELDTEENDSVKVSIATPDPNICPLCGKPNACLNIGAADTEKQCWCNDPNIKFPETLLSQIPKDLRRKACVCMTCVLEHQAKSKD